MEWQTCKYETRGGYTDAACMPRYIFLPFCILTFWVNTFGRVCQLPFPLYFLHCFIDQTFDSDHGRSGRGPTQDQTRRVCRLT